MIFSTYDKYGKIRESHPKIRAGIIFLIFLFAAYKTIEVGRVEKELFKTQAEKNTTNLLFAELTEENLEYYLAEPYCGYKIESVAINFDNLKRDVESANVFTKEYSAGKDNIKITLCYRVKDIDKKTQKHLLMILILFITSLILTRRHFAHEKAKFYETASKEISAIKEG